VAATPNFCGCGCGTALPDGLRFIRGHQLRRNSPVRKERVPSGISKADTERLEAEREKLIDARERIDGIPFKTIQANDFVRRDLRHKAQVDLYFLATDVLGIPLVERVHKPLCDFLVKKDPDKPLADWSELKKRLYMLPRNSFKSTVAVADVIQVILCDPNVRILIMRGTLRLAQQMLNEVKQHFVGNQKLRLLFPEFCGDNPKALGGRDELVCPARGIVRREPTISIGTVESSKVGLHADWLLLDDLVDDLNSRTPDGRDKVLGAFQMLTPIAEPWAYMPKPIPRSGASWCGRPGR
jgi:hypothetical protein